VIGNVLRGFVALADAVTAVCACTDVAARIRFTALATLSPKP
jgi:hypothetical protein